MDLVEGTHSGLVLPGLAGFASPNGGALLRKSLYMLSMKKYLKHNSVQ